MASANHLPFVEEIIAKKNVNRKLEAQPFSSKNRDRQLEVSLCLFTLIINRHTLMTLKIFILIVLMMMMTIIKMIIMIQYKSVIKRIYFLALFLSLEKTKQNKF
jgi:hypothetical protein